jgi:deazaflavin-dependent oxidoreductase (nitroreductase family)
MTKKKHAGIRRFNKALFNRLTRLFAGRVLYALVYHIGRRTGRSFATPVVAVLHDGSILIPLPYGADTDWYLNLKAAGRCRIKIRGKVYTAGRPELVGPDEALPAFQGLLKRALQRAAVQEYLQLKAGRVGPT